jgi:L-ascorbate metabolism protein UlaG (beta-lactamase superfamily)
MSAVTFTHIGGPTTLIEVEGWRILTDPTFDGPGRTYKFGWGTSSRKTAAPAIEPSRLGRVDAVLLTHDQHADNLDDAGRALLPQAGTVITTVSGARRLGSGARGLSAWGATRLESPGRPTITVTATPCRHGPPGSRTIVGEVTGFALDWPGQEHGAVWISGDTVLFDRVRAVASRLDVGTAIIHLGRVRFPITGRLSYTMSGADAVELCELMRPRTAIPVHYEGWSHFTQGREQAVADLAGASHDVTSRLLWAPIGEAVELTV